MADPSLPPLSGRFRASRSPGQRLQIRYGERIKPACSGEPEERRGDVTHS